AGLEVVAAQRDEPLRPLGARARQPRLAQQPQVVGAGRCRQPDLTLQVGAGALPAAGQDPQDLQPDRVARGPHDRREVQRLGRRVGDALAGRGAGGHGGYGTTSELPNVWKDQMSLMLSSPPKTERRTLGPTAAYAVASSVIGFALVASITPSPLYGTYRELWGFSPLVLTLVYATYAFGVLATLVLAGRVSDQAGRRAVLLVALGILMVTSVLYMLADSVVWLFV